MGTYAVEELATWRTVADLLAHKGQGVVTIDSSATISECAKHMTDQAVGSVLVIENGKLHGIFTWHDVLRETGEHPNECATTPVWEVMSTGVKTVPENAEIEDVEKLMFKERIRHVPVMRGEQVVGLVTRIDVLARHLQANEAAKRHLDSLIWRAFV